MKLWIEDLLCGYNQQKNSDFKQQIKDSPWLAPKSHIGFRNLPSTGPPLYTLCYLFTWDVVSKIWPLGYLSLNRNLAKRLADLSIFKRLSQQDLVEPRLEYSGFLSTYMRLLVFQSNKFEGHRVGQDWVGTFSSQLPSLGLVLDELNWKVKLTTLDAINGKAELKAGSRPGSKSMSPWTSMKEAG